MSDSTPAYIAIAPCGCCHAVTVDEPQYAKDVAKDIADWVKRGSHVEHTTVDKARELIVFDCPHDPKWGREPKGRKGQTRMKV